MARIVFAWELGSGYGHISKFMLIAQELTRRGHQVFCIARELQYLASRMSDLDIPLIQAPVWQQERTQATSCCYSDLLLNLGYYDTQQIQGMLMAWKALYHLISPDLLIADHAPTALLAARGLEFPTTTLGTGFFSPPVASPIPAFFPDEELSPDRLQQKEQQLLSQINPVLKKLEIPTLNQLADIFRCDDTFLCTYRELDHYPERGRNTEYLGAQFELTDTEQVSWPEHSGPKIFAYLKAGFAEIEKLLQALKLTEASIIIHAPAFPEQLLEKYRATHIHFHRSLINLETIRTRASLTICHAGHGTVTNMLLEGVPLLLLPMQMEQLVLARRVCSLGAGELISPVDPIRNYRKTIRRLLSRPEYTRQAQHFAARYADMQPAQQRNVIADRCESLVTA